MADLKITDLTAKSPVEANDVVPIVDLTAGSTKKATFAVIASYITSLFTATVTAYTRQHYPTTVAISSSAGALAVDCNLHALATCTLSENTTVGAASNQAAGKVVELIFTGASTYTLSWNVNWKMADGTTVSTTTAASKKTRVLAESDGTYMQIYRIIQES